MINRIKRKHGIKAIERHEKIEEIIKQGIDIQQILNSEIYEDETKENDKKKILQSIIEDKLELHLEKSGRTLDEKITILIEYYMHDEMDTNIGISKEGYDKLLRDLNQKIDKFIVTVKSKFQLDKTVQMKSEDLLEYNIKPKDVLYLLPFDLLKIFCSEINISYRGKNIVNQIIHHYTESVDIYIQNYFLVAKNDINGLKNNGIIIKADEIGLKFEEVTKLIFKRMNINVNEKLRKEINSKKEKADIILDYGNNDIYIVECKSSKQDYAHFSSVSRQTSSYVNFYKKNNYNVLGAILISGAFTDDFKAECDIFTDYKLSLLEAPSLYNIYEEFKGLKKSIFPHTLFRHGVIQSDIVIKALRKK